MMALARGCSPASLAMLALVRRFARKGRYRSSSSATLSSSASILALSSAVSLPSFCTAERMLVRRASRRLAASRAASSARSSVSSIPPVLSLR